MTPAPTHHQASDPQHLTSVLELDVQAAFCAEVRQSIPFWVRTLLTQATMDMESAQRINAVASDRQYTMPAVQLLKRQHVTLAEKVVLALEQSLDEHTAAAAFAPVGNAARPAPSVGGRLTLRLMDEAQIDQDIEIGRLVQSIEAEAELELKHLAAMCTGMLGQTVVDQHTLPLPPLACAKALHAGICALTTDPALRSMMLRQLGQATGAHMRQVYAAQSELLSQWGVLPVGFRLMPCADEVGEPAAAAETTEETPSEDRSALQASLRRLLAKAHDSAEICPAGPSVEAQVGHTETPAKTPAEPQALRLIDPLPLEHHNRTAPKALGGRPGQARATPALDRSSAKRLMQRFLDHIESQMLLSDTGVALLLGLRPPALALAVAEPRLWQTLDHPWWRLLDHVMAVCAIQEDAAPLSADPVSETLCRVVRNLQPELAGQREVWLAACNAVQAAIDRAVQERQRALEPMAGGLQSQVDGDELRAELRNQIVQQLRSTPVSPPLRSFLIDTWAVVLSKVALQHGAHSAELAAHALVVDDLTRATQEPGKPVSSAQRSVLMRQVQGGLALLAWPAKRLGAELAQLGALLDKPPPVQEEDWTEPSTDLPTAWTLDLNASLPTVALDMNQLPAAGEPTASVAWIQSLEVGAHCRLFFLGRWMTVQVSWLSETRNLFLFSSRHGGRVHSLTRRMLQKLREAGLAASIEDGLLLAQAMDSLVDTNFGAG